MSKVFTYYEDLGNGHEPLIELWAESWRSNGWTPVVLGEKDFLRSPHAKAVDEMSLRLPTVNPHGYERACYRRWAAMVEVGGGWMSDYDVLNLGFPGGDMAYPFEATILDIYGDNVVPCVVGGTRMGYEAALRQFIGYHPDGQDTFGGRPHVQEMTILRRILGTDSARGWLHASNLCIEYLEPGWEQAKLIHFHTGKVDGKKYEIMKREWERLRKP